MDQSLEIGYFDLEAQNFQRIASTDLWCWQMGCRLQWVEWKGKETILYNALNQGQPATILCDPETGDTIEIFDVPTYCISGDGRYVVSLDFDNLEACRGGYGYDWKATQKPTSPSRHAELILYDAKEKTQTPIVDTERLKEVHHHPSMDHGDAIHYFNHIHFNPSASRILCFHIWNTGGKRYVRALTMNRDGSDIKDVTKGQHVSHYWWLNDDEILFYCTDPHHGLGYHIYNQAGEYLQTLNKGIPNLDGHPSSPTITAETPSFFISDTVVNRYFERDLWLYDIKAQKRTDLAHFYSPPVFNGPNRCDLHPRLSPNSRYIAVDSAHKGYRQVVVLDIQNRLSGLT